MLKASDHIKSIKPYVPGKPIEELERELGISDSIKLASNENPLGPSPLAIKALYNSVNDLNRYPDGNCYHLRQVLSEKLQVQPEEIVFGNGSNEIIELAVRTFLCPGDEALMAHPSFVVYSTIVQAVQGNNIVVPLKNWRHDLQKMASKVTKKTKIVFIANPNNPTGTINTKAELNTFMKRIPKKILVIVDEAYYEYVASSDYADSMKYFREGRNILILRTFSKIYGLAGLRIGYGIAGAEIIDAMNRIRQPFNVNSLAQRAAVAALKDEKHLEKTKLTNEKGKEYLYKELEALKITYIPTEANFIYILLKDMTSVEIYNSLLGKGVIIRPMGENTIRVTIGLPKENRKFIKALQEAVWTL